MRSAIAGVLAGMSVRQIAREWNEQGLTTTTGKAWIATSVRKVLLNPRYAALRVHRGSVIGKGAWESLVTEDQHRGVVAYLSDPARASYVSFERKWQGSGVYRCGVCDERAAIHVGSNGRRSYKCPQNHVRRQGPALDKFVDALVIGRLSRPDARLLADVSGIDTAALQTKRDGLRARLDMLGAMLGRGEMDADQFTRGSAEVRSQLDEVDGELAAARQSGPVADLVLADGALADQWEALSPDIRGKVIDALMAVRVMPSPKGLRRFDPSFISIHWLG